MLGLGDNIGFEKEGDCLSVASAFSVGAAVSAGFCALPSDAIIIDAEDLGPAIGKRAEAVVFGEGLSVDGVGETDLADCTAGFVAIESTSSFAGTGSGSGLLTSAPAAPPFRRFGPLARPLRISCSCPPSAGGSLGDVTADVLALPKPAGLSDLDAEGDGFAPGGPRASMVASPGLNLDILLASATGGGETTRFSSTGGEMSGFSCSEGDGTVFSACAEDFSCADFQEGMSLS